MDDDAQADEFDPQSAIQALKTSLAEVEANLAPLLKSKWSDAIPNGPAESRVPGRGSSSLGDANSPSATSAPMLERAKMDVLVAYAINDLIWVYLKMKGIDPSTHEVTPELERISTYYQKIRKVEQPDARRTNQIDKSAAKRFIQASIPSSQRLPPASAGAELATTSAAASSRADARRRVLEQNTTSKTSREEEDSASMERFGMSQRFRFVGGEAGEKIIPSASGDPTQDDRDSGEGDMVIHGEEDDAGDVDVMEVEDEAEGFLNALKDEFEGQSGQK